MASTGVNRGAATILGEQRNLSLVIEARNS